MQGRDIYEGFTEDEKRLILIDIPNKLDQNLKIKIKQKNLDDGDNEIENEVDNTNEFIYERSSLFKPET